MQNEERSFQKTGKTISQKMERSYTGNNKKTALAEYRKILISAGAAQVYLCGTRLAPVKMKRSSAVKATVLKL